MDHSKAAELGSNAAVELGSNVAVELGNKLVVVLGSSSHRDYDGKRQRPT